MHELIFFSMFLLVLIRLIGVIVSVNFYYESKSNTYIFFLIAWAFWVLAGIIALVSAIFTDQPLEDLFLLINYISGPFAIFFIGTGLSSYYINISVKKIKFISVFLIIFPLIIYFIFSLVPVALYARISQFFGIIIVFLLPFSMYNSFKEKIEKSIRWYYLTCFSILIYIPLALISMLSSIGSFQSENVLIIIAVYSSVILMTILLIAFIIHVEYTISYKQQNQLKDIYSHNLGNIMQVINSSSDLINMSTNLTELDKKNLELIQSKCKESSKLIKEIRDL
ncbi:MAG: hypothetical protein ACFFA3_15070 [Promethearchaeota archaeon]